MPPLAPSSLTESLHDSLPTDDTLTHVGLDAAAHNTDHAPERILVLGCGAIAREILAVIKANGWDHIDLHCLPAILHNHPERIPDAVRQAVEDRRANYTRVCVAYADCGTGGQLQTLCDTLGVEMIAGPHCYSFFEGNDAFAARDEITAFYLTDFLVRQFDAFVWKPLGLDRHPDLRDMYFGHYETLVYQAQIDDPALVERAQTCADRLGLRFVHRPTGFGDLAHHLTDWAR
ncbi:MAG: DUF1638 domain-containing protein [Paracoccaceae bacterium]